MKNKGLLGEMQAQIQRGEAGRKRLLAEMEELRKAQETAGAGMQDAMSAAQEQAEAIHTAVQEIDLAGTEELLGEVLLSAEYTACLLEEQMENN